MVVEVEVVLQRQREAYPTLAVLSATLAVQWAGGVLRWQGRSPTLGELWQTLHKQTTGNAGAAAMADALWAVAKHRDDATGSDVAATCGAAAAAGTTSSPQRVRQAPRSESADVRLARGAA